MVIVPGERPGLMLPSLMTSPVITPLPDTVPASMLIVRGEPKLPPTSCVEPAVWVYPPLNVVVPLPNWTNAWFVNAGPKVMLPAGCGRKPERLTTDPPPSPTARLPMRPIVPLFVSVRPPSSVGVPELLLIARSAPLPIEKPPVPLTVPPDHVDPRPVRESAPVPLMLPAIAKRGDVTGEVVLNVTLAVFSMAIVESAPLRLIVP